MNETKIIQDLENHPEIITEAIQTILRKEGVEEGYEKLRDLSRGKKISMTHLRKFINDLDISPEVKTKLKRITPLNYTGLAEKLAMLDD